MYFYNCNDAHISAVFLAANQLQIDCSIRVLCVLYCKHVINTNVHVL